MFNKIYERLSFVNNINLSDKEKKSFEENCWQIVSLGFGIQEVIDSVYSFMCNDYSLWNSSAIAEMSLKLMQDVKML